MPCHWGQQGRNSRGDADADTLKEKGLPLLQENFKNIFFCVGEWSRKTDLLECPGSVW